MPSRNSERLRADGHAVPTAKVVRPRNCAVSAAAMPRETPTTTANDRRPEAVGAAVTGKPCAMSVVRPVRSVYWNENGRNRNRVTTPSGGRNRHLHHHGRSRPYLGLDVGHHHARQGPSDLKGPRGGIHQDEAKITRSRIVGTRVAEASEDVDIHTGVSLLARSRRTMRDPRPRIKGDAAMVPDLVLVGRRRRDPSITQFCCNVRPPGTGSEPSSIM